MMKYTGFLTLLSLLLFASACELRMAPSEYWSRMFKTQTDSKYYMKKAENLAEAIAEDIEEYDINRVSVMDLVDEENQPPILGEYIASRVIEAITREKFFRVTQKGEVNDALFKLKLRPSFLYTEKELQRLGKALNSQAIITGKLTDLGTNLDVHLTMTDIVTGEVIASATEHLTRTRFAVEMLRHH